MNHAYAFYGKGGIGKSTTASNTAVAMAKMGASVLLIGCDPKHDSTFTITGHMIDTVIDTLEKKNYHAEEIEPDDIIKTGYMGVAAVESGGPPAGVGCGGYVVGETMKMLSRMGVYEKYDVILFDVLGDVVCGGFATPLQWAEYAIIISANDFDSLFAANRICVAVKAKSAKYPVRLAGIVGNRVAPNQDGTGGNGHELIDLFASEVGTNLLGLIPAEDSIRRSRINGKTLFEIPGVDTSPYETLANTLLCEPEVGIPNPMSDRKVFQVIGNRSFAEVSA
jgi:light-independent protochlorophyllide reductase subunit L